MSTSLEANHQANYTDSEEAGVAAFTARNRELGRSTSVRNLQDNYEKHPNDAFPFSGDHLGTADIRAEASYTEDMGEVIGRVKAFRAEGVSIWH